MKSLVVYDSAYGNTEKVADAIGDVLAQAGDNVVKIAESVDGEDIQGCQLVVVGSPTQGGRPTKAIDAFIGSLPPDLIETPVFATFDTRFDVQAQKKPLQLLMKIIGYAAPKIAKVLKQKGGKVVSTPQGFIVNDQKGPLHDGELARAEEWAKELLDIYA